MHEGQQGSASPDGEAVAARFVAMSPTIISRWAREGRRFRAIAPPSEPDDVLNPAAEPGGNTGGS